MNKKKYLNETHPHLLKEWDYSKNGDLRPEGVSYGSSKRAWWRCFKNHSWGAIISTRTRLGYGCPYCSGRCATKENNLAIKFPALLEEWDYSKNKRLPIEFLPASNKKVWWKCSKCEYLWKTAVQHRAKKKTGCPACANLVATDKNNLAVKFPKIAAEWDKSRNDITPEEVVPGTEKRIWWKCFKGHSWQALIFNRTGKGSGCPACAGQAAASEKNLVTQFPAILGEWDYVKNKILPFEVMAGSHKKVWWSCSKKGCQYSWLAVVHNRTGGNGCPACSGRVATVRNNLAIKFPALAAEWSVKNRFQPDRVTPGTHKKAWWECEACSHKWKASIKSRAGPQKYGCPRCSGSSISKISQEWLDQLKVSKKHREHYIKKLGVRVDGFNPETNTVYEFLGDFWHGNPEKFSLTDINPKVKKTFGYLYKKTMSRFKKLEEAGYNIIYIWEKDYNKNKESINNSVVETT